MSFDTARYEGYGPGGAALIVDCLTDNRNRTVAKLRHVFTSYGGNLGAHGSVAYLFKPVGRMTYPPGSDAEVLRKLAIDAGAEDCVMDAEGAMQVLTDPKEIDAIRTRLYASGYVPARVEVTERASRPVQLSGADAESMLRLIAALRQLDGVQGVYSNAEISSQLLAQL